MKYHRREMQGFACLDFFFYLTLGDALDWRIRVIPPSAALLEVLAGGRKFMEG